MCPDVPAGTPRVGDAHAAADGGLGRRGTAAWCQGNPAGPADDVGRPCPWTHRVVSGDPRGDTRPPAEQSLLPTALGRREGQKSGADGLYAEVFDSTQR